MLPTIDVLFSFVGFLLGLVITFLNLIHTNAYLITIGPILSITCLLYLRIRNKILTNRKFELNINSKVIKIINILYFIFISIALIIYNRAPSYYRPPTFFISVSITVALLGLEIFSSKFNNNFNISYMILKILFISLVLRSSGYFISPYPVGADTWTHAEYIKNFLHFNKLAVSTNFETFYITYPLFHLLAMSIQLLGNINIRQAIWLIGVFLAFSTIFVYFIVKEITNNLKLALFSMLLLNFADAHISWSIMVIPQSFAIAIYTIILYLLVKRTYIKKIPYTFLLVFFILILIITHTLSSFVVLVSILSIYISNVLYNGIYRDKYKSIFVTSTICIFFIVLLLYQWMNPSYPFLDLIARGLIESFTKDNGLLNIPEPLTGKWIIIPSIIGFLVYLFFGIMGSLFSLSKNSVERVSFSFIFLSTILYSIYFGFPAIGLRIIIPSRWPSFIYVPFIYFVAIGFIKIVNIFKKSYIYPFLFIILLISSFFMITTGMVNNDSPIYNEGTTLKLVWAKSEMTLFEKVIRIYDGDIITDDHTSRIFKEYLQIERIQFYELTNEGKFYWKLMDNKLVIWRRSTLIRPIHIREYQTYRGRTYIFLGEEFKENLDKKFSCIYDIGEAKAYLN